MLAELVNKKIRLTTKYENLKVQASQIQIEVKELEKNVLEIERKLVDPLIINLFDILPFDIIQICNSFVDIRVCQRFDCYNICLKQTIRCRNHLERYDQISMYGQMKQNLTHIIFNTQDDLTVWNYLMPHHSKPALLESFYDPMQYGIYFSYTNNTIRIGSWGWKHECVDIAKCSYGQTNQCCHVSIPVVLSIYFGT